MKGRKLTRTQSANYLQCKALDAFGLGQQYSGSCPRENPHQSEPGAREPPSRLGAPLTISEVAGIIGCSPWTVRQTLIPQGLPVFRSAASGKLIFYRTQVERWIEKRQQQ